MSEVIDKLKEISKGMPSIFTEFPNLKFRNSDSIVDAIRLGKRKKISFNIGKTQYTVKPYLEIFDYMIRLHNWQESYDPFDSKTWGIKKTEGFRKPVAYRIDPTTKKQKVILGEFF